MMLGATISKAAAALLRWLGLGLRLVWPSWGAAATALLLIWRRLLRRSSSGDTAPWTELPLELLGLVLWRLPSKADRVRLRAVCRAWRTASLPPQFPWMVVLRDSAFATLPDGALHRLDICRGEMLNDRVSTGSTLFVHHVNGRCFLVNPFSKETTPLKINLPHHPFGSIRKVVLSDNILVVLANYRLDIIHRETRQGAADMAWVPSGCGTIISDIAVFQGKLYVLTRRSNGAGPEQLELHLLDINHEQNCVTSVQCISAVASAIETNAWRFVYLVASGNRLLMVERHITVSVPYSTPIYDARRPLPYCTPIYDARRPLRTRFEVSQGVDLIGGHGRWSRVDSLMGRALFVGRECSVSLPAKCGAREDCIYFMSERNCDELIPEVEMKPEDDLLDCVLYNVRDRTMEPLAWETDATRRGGMWTPSWLFPSDV